ncbi:hypothetical protein JG688_00017679 [Phytophthora aleatoria]|uniref:Uncharacterized protein n=1 Tax=Phytophthora aleatoria TaxID=2496075 RepID=A0A8J5IC36_9STRA|nr:hypothetical protein JG688_00017679 [Phytophthora aleatoria]
MHISYGLEEDWAHGMVVMAATTLMPDSDREDCAGLSSSGRWKATAGAVHGESGRRPHASAVHGKGGRRDIARRGHAGVCGLCRG